MYAKLLALSEFSLTEFGSCACFISASFASLCASCHTVTVNCTSNARANLELRKHVNKWCIREDLNRVEDQTEVRISRHFAHLECLWVTSSAKHRSGSSEKNDAQ